MTFLRLIPYRTPDHETDAVGISVRRQDHHAKRRNARKSVQDWLANDDGSTHPSSKAGRSTPESTIRSTSAGPGDPTPSQTTTSSNSDFLSRTTSERDSSTASPPSLPDEYATSAKLPFRTAINRLEKSVKSTRDAENLHAYDIGVCAALKSMESHWLSLSSQRHISSNEKRIFLREAQRLHELLIDAELETLGNEDRLARRQEQEDLAWAALRVSAKGMSGGEDEEVTRLTESISQLSLGEPLDFVIRKKQPVRIFTEEKGSESEDSDGMLALSVKAPKVYGVFG
ncbi:hypothetical protein B0T14DRAFT_251831 [Immersiella caudata]|uniref:Uncharacterized protein n=1 Tax=Immersiella caudata TaxID=314043 RepID=A0AA40BX33_9PEZI|nr:hypothetical protein B0T14DRAFT_251831 [Immersiella caudata]